MAVRIDRKKTLLVASAVAPVLILLAPLLPPVVQIIPLTVGLAVTAVAFRYGAPEGFAAYAIVAWVLAAIALAVQRTMDSSLSGALGDAAGIMTLCAVLAGTFPNIAAYVDRIWVGGTASPRERRVLVAASLLAPFLAVFPFAFDYETIALGEILFPILAGLAICAIAYRRGVRRSFLAYALVSWGLGALELTHEFRLDSPLTMAFGDAGFLGAAAALVAGLAWRPKPATSVAAKPLP